MSSRSRELTLCMLLASIVLGGGGAHAASARLSLLPGAGEAKWLVRLDLQGFAAGSPVYISASGMRADGQGQLLTPFQWSYDHPSGDVGGDGSFSIQFRQSDWGSFTYEAHDAQGNQAHATLAWNFGGKVIGSIGGSGSIATGGGTEPPAGEWDYLSKLYPDSSVGRSPQYWQRRDIHFEGVTYTNSYEAYTYAGEADGAFSLAKLRHPGQPKILELKLGVNDETAPDIGWRVEIRLDNQPPQEYTVRLREPALVRLSVAGVGRVEFTARCLNERNQPWQSLVMVEPKVYY